MVGARAHGASKLPLSPWSGLTRPTRLLKRFIYLARKNVNMTPKHGFMLLSLHGRVKPDHGERGKFAGALGVCPHYGNFQP